MFFEVKTDYIKQFLFKSELIGLINLLNVILVIILCLKGF
jgi:hypothetical protein